ncbi:fimbria/pilus outer membrane usher protein [Enterobacter kobei]|uniref:fimbria/pilus outer membrane usher protein n=1 Tax=Enterobacter kobei TaxID=208224 RepID=UPI003BDC156E
MKNQFLYWLLGVMLYSPLVHSDKYTFDADLLGLSSGPADISVFNDGGQLPGTYSTDVIVNNSYIMTEDITFLAKSDITGHSTLFPCLSIEMLSKYGILTDNYPELIDNKTNCAILSVIQNLSYKMNVATQELNLSVPQVAIRKSLKGIAPIELWDKGINAFRFNYNANISQTSFKNNSDKKSQSLWFMLQPGINFEEWRFRNQSVWQKNASSPSNFSFVSSYAERDLNAVKSQVVIGEKSPSSELFDSFNFRGVMLGTNDRMMPFYYREFGPVIRGVAETQTRVTVSQNGNSLYNEVLPPGPYVIDDLSVIGQSGELLVTTEDISGYRNQNTVVWQSPAIAVKQNYFRYDIMAGEYIPADTQKKNENIAQLTMIYGLPLDMTAYGGVRKTGNFFSYLSGGGISLGKAGSFSLDRTTSVHKDGTYTQRGHLQRFRYSGLYNDSRTSFIATASYSPSNSYRTLDESILEECNVSNTTCGQRGVSKRLDFNMRQTLTQRINVYASYSFYETHNNFKNASSGAGISTLIPYLGYVSGDYFEYRMKDNMGLKKTDRVVSASVNIPLTWFSSQKVASTMRMMSSGNRATYDTGINGSTNDQRFSWNINQLRTVEDKHNNTSTYAYTAMTSKYNDTEMFLSTGNSWEQYGVGIHGGMVMHSKGITASKSLGETIALIDTNGAEHVSIISANDVETDSSGYAVIPYLSPYQINTIEVDPTSLQENDDISQTDINTVPTSGAIVRVSFINQTGNRLLINLKTPSGKKLPFGSIAVVKQKEGTTGIVDENGQLYMSGMPDKGEINVKMSETMCKANYELKEGIKSGLQMLNLYCE